MQTFTLNNGVEMPAIGFGVYQISDHDICERSVSDALEAGYRMIDTASIYGNEAAVGKAIHKSGLKREDYFITTKHWIHETGYEKSLEAFKRSQDRLGLDVIDLYLVHQPFGDTFGSWRALQELLAEGKVRAIGVSNFYPDRLTDLVLNTGFAPSVNQVEINPVFQQHEAQEWNEKYGVRLEGWAPLGQGKLDLFENPLLIKIAKKHGKTVAQVVLRWLNQRGIVVIPKSTHKERIIENFAIFDFSLDEADMAEIKTMDQGRTAMRSHFDPNTVIFLSEKRS